MACNQCGGGSSPVRVKRYSTGSSVAKTQKKPLRPLKRNSTIQVIRPANHLDKRM